MQYKIIGRIGGILSFLGLKKNVLRFLNRMVDFSHSLYNGIFNEKVKGQNNDYSLIPIVIISFNQLDHLKSLVNFLLEAEYKNIVIIDNNSSYPPLLEYLNAIKLKVTIHFLNQNYGHMVFWKEEWLFQLYSKGYYVVTDPDIVPINQCPKDFLKYFKKIIDRSSKITKVGFSLKIDDLPETNKNRDRILKWEKKFWESLDKNGNYKASIDTTFALYRPGYSYNKVDFYNGIRAKFPYIAKHGGWYINNENLNEEQLFYLSTCNSSSSWRTDWKGNLIHPLYLK